MQVTPLGGFASDAPIDVVFVHGLGGDIVGTWTHDGTEDGLWPSWISSQYQNCNVFVAGYPSPKVASVTDGTGQSIAEQAGELLDYMTSAGLGSRPLVFICHSLGGILVKEAMRMAFNETAERKRVFFHAVVGIVFLGTPHKGSNLANFAKILPEAIFSKLTTGLGYGDERLLELEQWFRNHLGGLAENIRVYAEGHKTGGLKIVDKISSDPGISNVTPVVISADHIELAKPKDAFQTIYLGVCALLDSLLAGLALASEGHHGSEAPVDNIDPDDPLVQDFEYYTNPISEDDRLSLEEKLDLGGRHHEITDAIRAKEDFSKIFLRNILQPQPIKILGRMLAEVAVRYNGHVYPQIIDGESNPKVSAAIHKDVLEPVYQEYKDNEYKELTIKSINGALYYLGGNCHIKWHGPSKETDDVKS